MSVASVLPRVAAAEARPRRAGPLGVGQVVDGRYQVLEVLSNGPTADVYRVRHRVLGRNLALKALRPECSRDAELCGRLLREAKALGALDHPNIVKVTDCGWLSETRPYFVMEYVAGVALDRLLWTRAPLEAGQAVAVAAQVCDALAAAHDLGIVHRDLKPDNICVMSSRGRNLVKVLDFGLARVVGQGRLTRPNTTQGTPEYMSPEQATGREVDARTDIYSLGVTLYEMLCGRRPFEADSYVALAHQHMYAPPPPFRRWLTEGSAALAVEATVRRCLQKDPAARYASARELAASLEPFRGPDKTLRLPSLAPRRRQPAQASAGPDAAPPVALASESLSPGSGQRALSYGRLFHWTLIGCCLGTLMLVLVYWMGSGRG